MKMKILLLLIMLTLVGCLKIDQFRHNDDLQIELITETIHLPNSDSLDFIDTLNFKITNSSKTNYYFTYDCNTVIFIENFEIKNGDEYYADPIDGIAIRFLDENEESLPIEGHEAFLPEGFTNYNPFPKENIHLISENSVFDFKVLIKFPSKIDFDNYIQRVPNIGRTKFIEVYFLPEKSTDKELLDIHGILLNKKNKLLTTTKKFKIPVEIIY